VILTWKSNVTILQDERVLGQDMDVTILVRNGKRNTGHAINGEQAQRSITNK